MRASRAIEGSSVEMGSEDVTRESQLDDDDDTATVPPLPPSSLPLLTPHLLLLQPIQTHTTPLEQEKKDTHERGKDRGGLDGKGVMEG